MDLGIKGRVAVVTGGDSGIGFATASMLLEEGARVALTDVAGTPLDEAVARLAPKGEVVGIPADLVDVAHAQALERAVAARLGQAEILVHAAGISGPTGRFEDLTDDDWRRALDVDLLAAVRVLRAFLPHMRRGQWGRVVLLASEDAVQPHPDELPYGAAKAGLLNLAKGLSKSCAASGILVNTVSPAFVATPMTDAMLEKRAEARGGSVNEAIESFLAEERPGLVLGRRGRPEEVAAAILFLCSAQASFCTGANLRVDGGSVTTVPT